MAEKTPVRVNYDGSNNAIGFAEYQAADFIGIDDGGTGAITASGARTALGIQIGVDVQGYDSDLATIAGLTHADGGFIVSNGSAYTIESGATARSSLGLGTSDSPTFNGLSITNNVTISGNLTVDGTQTILNTETLTVDDNTIVLNNNVTGSPTEDAGIEIERGTSANKSFIWDESNDYWSVGSDSIFAATFIGNLTGNVTGTVSSLSNFDTDNLTEGSSNLYFTDERVDDRVAALLIDSNTSGIDISYDDANGQLTISSDLSEVVEALQDNVQGLFVGGTGVTTAYDDASNALTLSIDFSEFDSDNIVEGSTNLFVTNERIDDRVNALLTDATTSGIDISYDDAGNALTLSVDLSEIVESLQDNVQGLFSGGTGITTSYDDNANSLSLSIDFSEFDTDNITEGSTNLYFTNARADARIAAATTDDLTEGSTNLYYTDARAQAVSINNVVEDTTPQLGGNLDLNSSNITGTGDIDTTGSFTLTSTSDTSAAGPIINLVRDSASPADADYLGQIKFKGDDDGGASTVYAKITGKIDDASAGTEDGLIEFAVIKAGSSNIAARLKSNNFQLLNGTGLEVAGNATITGDLTVNGTTTTIDTTNTVVSDSLIELANGTSGSPANDAGIVIERGSSDNAFIGFDESADKFIVGTGSFTGASTGNLTISTGTIVANLEGTVPQSSVTAHQAALTITESQISDLQSYLTAETNDLSSAVTWANVPDANITQSSVTQHQAALSITESQISDLGSYITATSSDTLTGKTINFENNTVIVEYAVTASGGNFLIDGEANASISFSPGIVYRFDLSDSSVGSHPFKLSTTSNGSHAGGSEYTTGKTTNGSQGSSGAYVEYTVNAATPDILYYYCSSHSGMGGTITVFGSSYGDSDVQAYISAGSGISISGSGQISSTITQYADSDVQSYISAGSGISISGSGQISSTITQYADSDVASYLTTNNYATQSYVTTQVNNVIDSAPGALDTLNELAAALGDDANFSTTVTNSIATKLATADFTSTANTWLATKDTDNLSEGSTNLYFTNARFNTQLATKDTADLTEGTNLYFTNARADARIALANLEDLADVGFSSPGASENQKVVSWDNSSSSFVLSSVSGLSGSGETNTASNVGTAGVGIFKQKSGEDLQFKKLNAGSAKITITDDTSNNEVDINLGTVSVGDLSDVDITTSAPTNGQALVWNASNSEFEPGTVASSTNYFQNIAVSGQTTVSPDSTTDTLTFAAGSNITLTTDASTDTVTIASTDTNTQLTQEQVEDFVNGVIVAGANITKTYDDNAGTLTIAATGGAANAFSTLAVAGQSNVVADATTDTLTLVAGTGMTLTTDASADSITFASTGGSAGSMPVTLAGGTADPINLSSISTIGAIPFTGFDGSTDNIDLTGTSQTLTSFADNDGDTKLEVERSTDNDTVHIKAGGTDVLTATSSGVTISNLTVTGTSTQANEMKITDTLIELNADATSLGVDAGLVIERGNTGADAAFIWDESSDSFAVGLLSADKFVSFTKANGNAQDLPVSSNEIAFNHADGTADNIAITSDNLAFTEADGTSDPIAAQSYSPETDMNVKLTDATLKAKTQTTGDNSTAVATTAFVQASLGGVESDTIKDADNDTKIQAEASTDADELVFTTGGQERAKMDNNMSMSARGGFFTHNLAMHASETFTIASTEGTVAAGPLDIQGTVDVQGSLVVL